MSEMQEIDGTVERFRANRAQIFLDYDGTLVPIRMNPEECYPDKNLLQLLEKISASHELYIITGRSMEDITEFLGKDINVVALHGAIGRIGGKVVEFVPDLDRYRKLFKKIELNLRDKLKVPGLRFYEKDGGLVLHLGLVDPAYRSIILNEYDYLCREYGLEKYYGINIVEFRIRGVNKGRTITKLRKKGMQALIAGDEDTDEDSFLFNGDAITIRIGKGKTNAKYSVPDYMEFRKILHEIAYGR
ncbi:MAG: trehalose-phosphatase [Thermoplasmataceae archaeon]